MKWDDRRMIGILGTVVIHLIAGIIFMLFQIRSIKNEISREYELEYIPEEKAETKTILTEQGPATVENMFRGDDEMLNIARNIANKPDVKINPADYIDKVKDELIKSGKLGKDNYIDEQKKLSTEDKPDNETDIPDRKNNQKEEPDESAKMAANYQGPTRIYYDLAGRNHLYLSIPIYKCQGSGMVVMFIDVNQKGIVEKAQVIPAKSTTDDPCLVESAVNAALISRFNSDVNSPKIQRGTLSYQFVAQ
jgi:hypothetical protein